MSDSLNTPEADATSGTGGGSETGPQIITLTFEGSTAAYHNSLGHYYVDPTTGTIAGVGIAFEDARPEFSGGSLVPGASTAQFEVPPGVQVGTFLIANGDALNDFASLGEGQLQFLGADGTPATLSDAAPRLVHVASDGTHTELQGEIWHSAGFGDRVHLNPDGAVHLKGISENGDGSWTFGFEDLPATGWDADFTDVTFSVALGASGVDFLNPDFAASGDLVDPGFGDEDSDEFDVIGGTAEDDVIHAAPGDSVDGGEGYDTLILDGQEGNVLKVDFTTTNNPDGTVSKTGQVHFKDGAEPVTFKNIEKIVPCFTPGTMIETDEGRVPVEELLPGDRVLTRDHGYRRLEWVGCKEVTPELLAQRPEFAPVAIARGALGEGLPEREMLVSPQHRMLFWGARAELLFGEREVLVPALHLVGLHGVRRLPDRAVTYIHIMCDRHEIVRADGTWSESFQPGDLSLAGLDEDQRTELLALFPELGYAHGRRAYTAARLSLKAHEARALIGR